MSKRGLRILLAFGVLAASLWVPKAQPAPAQTSSTRLTPNLAIGDFVTVEGNQLFYKGGPIKLKGINFYPKDHPWASMWDQWDGPATKRDLSAAQALGVNTVRVLVPYSDWMAGSTVRPDYLSELQQMVQMAGDLDMKVILTLFDFYDPKGDNPAPGSEAESRNKAYLQQIVTTFANDDRVLAWDMHNEPDRYATWDGDNDPAKFIEWLSRMVGVVRSLDHNHPITVGAQQYDNLFVSDKSGSPPIGQQAKGKTLADLSDFLSFHSYNVGNIDWQVQYIQNHSPKAIVLEETGWPTGPPCQQPEYQDSQQIVLYDLMLKGARNANLSGVVNWQLWDLQPGASLGGGKESNEDYFGLLKRDGTQKPAASVFRDGWPGQDATVPAPPLPSRTKTSILLTVQPPKPVSTDPNYQPPYYFPETGHYIYSPFREYWKRFGGLEVFGYPITEVRKEKSGTDEYWVQYFERARFELHPEVQKQHSQDWNTMDKNQQLKLLVQLTRLGSDLVDARTAGKGYPAFNPATLPPDATYFDKTGHSISGKIGEYWRTHDGLTNFGYPLSEPVQEVNQINGKTYLVQYFERTRLEYHPEYAGTQYEVLLGLMGRELMASRGCK